MIRVEIFTDGACSGNPGPGGWGALLRCRGVEKELSGGEKETTNNRMELTAVISALAALKTSCDISLYTDSKYVMDGITRWLPNWKKNGWKTSNKKSPVKNVEFVAAAGRTGRRARNPLDLGKRPCRPCGKRTGGRTGQKRDQEFGLNRLMLSISSFSSCSLKISGNTMPSGTSGLNKT